MCHALACCSAALLLSAALTTAVLGAERADSADKSLPRSIEVTSRRPVEDATLDRALDQIVSADFRDAPPDSLPAFLKTHQVVAVLDVKALSDAGISPDSPLLNLKVDRVSLRSLLKNVARQADLEFVIRDGRVLITTPDKASSELLAKLYRVDDLLYSDDTQRSRSRGDYSSLIELIENTAYPSSWDEVGGPSSMGAYQGTLFIAQTNRGHDAIDRLLSALGASRAQQRDNVGSKSIWVDSPQQIAALDNFQKKANVLADFEFKELPLVDAVAALAKAYDLPLILDLRSLNDAGIHKDTPITAKLQQVSLEDVVDSLLDGLDLTFMPIDEVVWITTLDTASAALDIVVYPVADLVQSGTVKIGASGQDFTSLMELITSSIYPSSWDEVGGPGSMSPHRVTSSLVISQTRPAHLEITRLLAGLREIRVPPPARQARADVPDDAKTAGSGGGTPTKVYLIPAGLDAKTVAALVHRLDAPSWSGGGHSLRLNGNQLVVRHTRTMHRRIEELLRDGNPQQPGGGMGGGMF